MRLENIINELKSIIRTAYPRFKQPDRIIIDFKLTDSDLGYEDLILLVPAGTGEPQLLSKGKLDGYLVKLVYLKKMYKNQVINLVDFFEKLDDLLVTNAFGSYWYQMTTEADLETELTDYLPEDYTEQGGTYNGFILNLTIKSGKFGTID